MQVCVFTVQDRSKNMAGIEGKIGLIRIGKD